MQIQIRIPIIDQFIKEQVEAGHFPTPEAVVEYALQRRMAKRADLTPEERAKIGQSQAQIDNGASGIRRKYDIN